LPCPCACTAPHPPSRQWGGHKNIPLDVLRGDITNEDVSKALKAVATVLDYPTAKGIPIDRIDTHSLRSGGTNALSLSGYSDTQIQENGTVARRYIQRIHPRRAVCVGMSKSMKKKVDFVNIAGNAFNTITDDLIIREYEVNVSAASAAQTGGKRADQMMQHSVAAERLRFILAFSLNIVSTGSPPAGAGGRCRCV